MITVKLLGGAKKSLSTDKMEIEKDDLTVAELIESLQKSSQKNMPPLDVKNMLVAITVLILLPCRVLLLSSKVET